MFDRILNTLLRRDCVQESLKKTDRQIMNTIVIGLCWSKNQMKLSINGLSSFTYAFSVKENG